ncbi:MBL fold metallo-hydrolase [Thiomicrorhabdus sediminis]|uniref:MBL fold metallo-hydrolase n=1 Tax=Thiomicrorhabdus sediminis TaxID=2580412 RepID=A0A4P9K460_9GAMM|nr:MBL fold metallo-hydrolase [Thiomicrorhabdus sediminis]QCU89702.1 MBL fold metallo-hydrolase [Thiomicrorhabdus sediminis]
MNRRDLLKSAFGLSAGLVGMSALKPLYASDGLAFKADPMYDVPATKVTDRCYYILAQDPEPSPENHAFFNNPGFIVTSEGVVVVDTGSSVQIGEMVLRQIKKVTDKPVVAVINTHYHGDHFLGNHAFIEANPKVEILSHQATIDNIKNGGGEFWHGFMQRNSNNGISGTVVTLPNKVLNGGETLKFGDTTVKIHQFGKAHTECDLIVEVVEDKTIFLGDTAMRRVANMADGSFVGTIDTMKKARDLGGKNYILGHGPHDGVSICDDMQAFCENIYNSAAKYYDEGLSDFEMKPKIMAQPFMKDVASSWPGYESTVGKFIAVAVQEVEQNMF